MDISVEDNIYSGTDIYGKWKSWNQREFPKKYKQETREFINKQQHLNKKQPYPIFYEAIKQHCRDSAILSLKNDIACKINEKQLEYKPVVPYLGTELHAQDENCLISSYLTMNKFKNKLHTKEDTLFRYFRAQTIRNYRYTQI